ncbi:protein ROOT HAIR DEFECTIVE 3-like [Durio zibethinus]|uniref:Protein ROOT HAIR DEFECTIVE 3-like n=1 Tax=Durio zibethinus TaxID=66656 RepID=A0A6P6AHJ0_DURZI|nr:protein ROOT HAIR DEFECTIVE 3-like [Durio zibethinus]
MVVNGSINQTSPESLQNQNQNEERKEVPRNRYLTQLEESKFQRRSKKLLVAGLRKRLLESISRSGLVVIDKEYILPIRSSISYCLNEVLILLHAGIRFWKQVELYLRNLFFYVIHSISPFALTSPFLHLNYYKWSTGYAEEAFYFDEKVRNEKREQLEPKALNVNYIKQLSSKPGFVNKRVGFAAPAKSYIDSVMLEFDQACAGNVYNIKYVFVLHVYPILAVYFSAFSDATIRKVNWDTSEVGEKLSQDIDSYKSSVCEEILSKGKVRYEVIFLIAIPYNHATYIKLLSGESEIAISLVSAGISGLKLEVKKSNKMIQDLKEYASNVVQRKAREEAGKSSPLNDSQAFVCNSCHALDEKSDKIEKIAIFLLLNGKVRSKTLASNTWPKVQFDNSKISHVKSNVLLGFSKGYADYTSAMQFVMGTIPSRFLASYSSFFVQLQSHSIGIAQTVLSVAAIGISVLCTLSGLQTRRMVVYKFVPILIVS